MEDPKENKSEEEKQSMEEKPKEPFIEGELIYNEEKGNQDMEKLFNDEEGQEYDTYEIETNGTYYYHAYAQTDQYKNEYCLKEERKTQTYEYRTCSTKMTREFGTQMAYVGLYIDQRQDKELSPTEYFTSEKWEEK